MSSRTSRFIAWAFILGCLICSLNFTGCRESSNTLPISSLFVGSFTTTTGTVLAPVGTASGTVATVTTTVTTSSTGSGFDITGTVYDSGTVKGVANIKVTLKDSKGGSKEFSSLSNGMFKFLGLASGFYTIYFEDTDYETFSYGFSLDESGNLSSSLDALIKRNTYSLKGRVLSKSSSQDPISNAEVFVDSLSNQPVNTTSNGDFVFPQLQSGLYTIIARKGTGFEESRIQIEIKKGGEISPTDVILYLPPSNFTIMGYVKLDTSKEALSGVTVEMRNQNGVTVIGSPTYSTGEGKFIFQERSPGLYILVTSMTGFYPASYVIQIMNDGTISPPSPEIYISRIPSQLKPGLASGTIRDAFSGAPLEYVSISLKGYQNVLSDKNGYFDLGQLAPGKYDLEFYKDGFEQLNVSFSISESGAFSPTLLNYTMIYTQEKNLGSIAGRYVPEDGSILKQPYFVRIYWMDYTTKLIGFEPVSGNAVYSSHWEYSDPISAIKSTRTGTDTKNLSVDESGSFKITHLAPTTTLRKYLVFVGKNENSSPGISLYHENPANFGYYYTTTATATWRVPVTNDATEQIHYWNLVDITANVTTFLTNYDKENN